MGFLKNFVPLVGKLLLIAMVGQGAMTLFGLGLPLFSYAIFSGVFLGFVPFSQAVDKLRPAGISRLFLICLLLGVVSANCVLVAWANHSDLGWAKGEYTLAMPPVLFFLAMGAPFLCHPSKLMLLINARNG